MILKWKHDNFMKKGKCPHDKWILRATPLEAGEATQQAKLVPGWRLGRPTGSDAEGEE